MSGIRIADIPDMKALCELAQELLDQSFYADIKPDEQKFKTTMAGLMGHKRGIVLVVVDDDDKPQGFLAGIVDEYAFSRYRYATDMWTYIRKSYRRHAFRLYSKFIDWAKAKPRVVMIELAMSSGNTGYDRWCKLMERLGFNRVGSLFMLRIEQCPA